MAEAIRSPRFVSSVKLATTSNRLITLNIDPGTTESAWLTYNGERPLGFGVIPNSDLLKLISSGVAGEVSPDVLVIEKIAAMGMKVGQEVFETVFWSGRFCEAWSRLGRKFDGVKRNAIKLHICESPRAKDPNIRAALIDRFGGESVAIGGKKCWRCKGKGTIGREKTPCICAGGLESPVGALNGISSHCWAALAVAVTWYDQNAKRLAPSLNRIAVTAPGNL